MHGAAPERLDDLVPGYLDAIPTTEYPGDETFYYSAWNHLDGEWQLYVHCEPFGVSSYPDLLRLVSTDRRWLLISTQP
ncbi:MAG: hypothetical protein IPJ77_04220 [Planctomycetes bacterium]|nr:hypothetical protein [Planctomycetota bacterium]